MAALIKIVNDPIPPLPEKISAELRDFLTKCFQKEPELRINASDLLKHPWLNSHDKSAMKDIINSPSKEYPEEVTNTIKLIISPTNKNSSQNSISSLNSSSQTSKHSGSPTSHDRSDINPRNKKRNVDPKGDRKEDQLGSVKESDEIVIHKINKAFKKQYPQYSKKHKMHKYKNKDGKEIYIEQNNYQYELNEEEEDSNTSERISVKIPNFKNSIYVAGFAITAAEIRK